MRVVATAGHVDHGKSTLIRALTGIDPDRLQEERERGMTIDLGFAWLRLPGGEEIGIVDVPGHQDFVRNMLAGVGGIDAVLLVVALDEGVMPQTREHLAILELLGVTRGVVALTKRDLVDDDLAALARDDVRKTLSSTPLADAPLVEVSALTGAGLDALVASLERVLGTLEPRRDLGRPRLPVDRAFTMPGFGAVVTGTLRDGFVAVGDEVEIVPGGTHSRVRGLQTHRQKIDRAVPGSRVAMNLAGVDASSLRRGLAVVRPGTTRATSLLTARAVVLRDASRALAHDATVKVYVGTAEVVARVSVLDAAEIAPGGEGWIQLRLAEPAVALVGDRFVLRVPSPPETIGGGTITAVDARRLRRTPDTIAALDRGAAGSGDAAIVAQLATPATRTELARRVTLPPDELAARVDALVEDGAVVALDPFLVARDRYDEIASRARAALESFHRAHPLRAGMPKEELRNALRLEAKLWTPALQQLVADGRVVDRGALVAAPDHRVVLPPRVERAWHDARRRLAADETQPPSATELGLDAEAVAALAERGDVVRLAPEIVLLPDTVRRFGAAIVDEAAASGRVSVSRARDLTGSSRKYVLPLLQFLDNARITRRAGEERVLALPPGEAKARLEHALTHANGA
ncbi:MAG TPA: selenocysteine-specific translation elongation factor [Candidatus Dormibacteraeota bacterium]|nr:selenocysteine-specific translation elongation factor [Candidatus Dormibacteraeota bacterium]